MSFNMGVNVVEVDGRAAPSIQAAPTSQTGFVVRSDRGLPAAVRRITSFKQFTSSSAATARTRSAPTRCAAASTTAAPSPT